LVAISALVLIAIAVIAWPRPDPLRDFPLISGRKASLHIPPGPPDWAEETWVFAFSLPSSDLAPAFLEGAAVMGFSKEEIDAVDLEHSTYGMGTLTKRSLGVLLWQIQLRSAAKGRFTELPSATAYVVVYKSRPDSWLAHLFSR
jgi:hypothetical protein